MNIFMRPITALCTLLLLGLAAPALAQTATLSTADRQVCCSGNDAAGNLIFFLAPASQCPKNRVVALERCKQPTSGPVCCKTPNGFFMVGSTDRCKAAGGAIVPKRYCEKPREPVCCKLPNGQFSKLIPDRCKRAGGAPVPGRYCKPVSRNICCKTPNGFYSWTAAMCRRAHGTVVNPRYCRNQGRRVCCKTRRGFSWENSLKCRPPVGAPVNPRYCQNQPSERICCKYPKADGSAAFGLFDPKRCKALHGSQVPSRYCLKATDKLRLRGN